MTSKTALQKETEKLKDQLNKTTIPPELKKKVEQSIYRLGLFSENQSYTIEYDRISKYISWITSLPWQTTTTDLINLKQAQKILDDHHYGMQEVKNRILEQLSVITLSKQQNLKSKTPTLCLVGLVGTGKTSFGPSLSQAINRNYIRIPFGGLGSAKDVRGQSRLHIDAEPGIIIKAIQRANSKNPVILLDEIDRVTEESRADIMGVLVELLDPEQNKEFTDRYLDFPFDLSQVFFIVTANNTRNIATAVLDRLEIIRMPSYNDEEKIIIAKNYLFPKALQQSGLKSENLAIDKDVWIKIIRPLGYDAGIRTLDRTINAICRKIARFIVEGQTKHFNITLDNVKKYLPSY